MRDRSRQVVVCAVLLAALSTGCANVMTFLFGTGRAKEEARSCAIEEPTRLRLVPLDASWVEADLDCPTTGESTIAFTTEASAPQLAAFTVEVLSGEGAITVRRRDGNGPVYRIAEASRDRVVQIPSFALRPETVVYVASDAPLRFRIRKAPSRATPVAPTPRRRTTTTSTSSGSGGGEPADDDASASGAGTTSPPEPPPANLPPGVVAVSLTRADGDPIRAFDFDRGRSGGVLVGQTGRVIRDGTRMARFCVDEARAESARARLASRLPADTLTASPGARIEIDLARTRRLELARISGNPVHEIEVREGEGDCLAAGMTGRLESEGSTIGTFSLRRVVPGRAWVRMDEPVDRAVAASARIVLELGAPADTP